LQKFGDTLPGIFPDYTTGYSRLQAGLIQSSYTELLFAVGTGAAMAEV